MEFFLQPWAWYVSGPLIAFTMFLMFYLGKHLGISSSLESMCAISGAGRFVDYFKFDWRKNAWNLVFMLGLVLGGFIAMNYLTPNKTIAISTQTIADLNELGFQNAGKTYLPQEIFSLETLLTVKGTSVLLIAGILVGFGSRYAGGCTSGHAIVGLSMLELPSLISVIGFFIGGLVMTWFILPLIFS
ncbi:MAG: YeeE/YedE family protein [Flavobacteriaceae bacterium]|nr:YeeE/YedE family protein [Flavobacteriaceae bacterium]